MERILGYVLALIGLIGIAIYAIPPLKSRIPLPEQISAISETAIIIISAVILIAGIFLIWRAGKRLGSQRQTEVPVLEGSKVVAYRRN
jgi:hypothetical protein